MTELAAAVGGQELAGHNRISTQALTSIAKAAAAEALGVPAGSVRVGWTDDDGLLALALALPIGIHPLGSVLRDPARIARMGGSIVQRATGAKVLIMDRVQQLSGSALSRVDIRVTGVQIIDGGRVQ